MGDPNFEALILADPPRHGEIRSILMKALRPSMVRSLKPRVAAITDEFLDAIQPDTEVDFLEQFLAAMQSRGFSPQDGVRLYRGLSILAMGAAVA